MRYSIVGSNILTVRHRCWKSKASAGSGATCLVLAGRGILAADESGPAMDARLRLAGVTPGAGNRRAYGRCW